MNTRALVYDIEIVKAVPGKNEPRIDGIEYCAGWQDHTNMGISVIGAYDYVEGRSRVFCEDNFEEFSKLALDRNLLVSFNGIGFDDKVLLACKVGLGGVARYDLLREIWLASGLGPDFRYPSHTGFGLDATAALNLGAKKTSHGALAPVDWQRGKVGAVIDYCLNDVLLTKRLFDKVLAGEPILSPKNNAQLRLRTP